MSGLRCLDVATFDGFYAFELERRGAAEVVAIDLADAADLDWLPRRVPAGFARGQQPIGAGFRVAAEARGSQVRRVECSVYDLDPDVLGTFDVVVCGALLQHLRDPHLALQAMRRVCRGQLLSVELVDETTSLLLPRRPVRVLRGANYTWAVGNVAAHAHLLDMAGWDVVTRTRLGMARGATGHAMDARAGTPALEACGDAAGTPGPGRHDRPGVLRDRGPPPSEPPPPRGGYPMSTLDLAELRRRVDATRWYHTLELAPGVVTPGEFDLREAAARLPWPDVRGKRCLDVATFDGFYAFELERRGAAEVVAIDLDDAADLDWLPRRVPAGFTRGQEPVGVGFRLAHEVYGSSVRRVSCSVYDLDPDTLGTFDVVVCGALLQHLRDPFRALLAMRRVCGGELLSVEHVDPWLSLVAPAHPRATGAGRPADLGAGQPARAPAHARRHRVRPPRARRAGDALRPRLPAAPPHAAPAGPPGLDRAAVGARRRPGRPALLRGPRPPRHGAAPPARLTPQSSGASEQTGPQSSGARSLTAWRSTTAISARSAASRPAMVHGAVPCRPGRTPVPRVRNAT